MSGPRGWAQYERFGGDRTQWGQALTVLSFSYLWSWRFRRRRKSRKCL